MLTFEVVPGRRRVGVLGGTFDPIHTGHLAAANEVRHQLGLEIVLFIPNRIPPHKLDRPVTREEDRTAMVRLAVASNPTFDLDTAELDRAGPSYSLETLRGLRRRYGEDVDLVFMVGIDALRELHTWHEPDAILAEFGLVVMDRADEGRDGQVDAFNEVAAHFSNIREQTRIVHVPQLAISSAEIRRRVREGAPIRYLVPLEVEDYIGERGLYR